MALFSKRNLLFLVLVLVIAGSGSGAYFLSTQKKAVAVADPLEKYVKFDLEAYDIIKAQYWQKASDADLSQLFLLSIQRAAGTTTALSSPDRAGVEKLLPTLVKNGDDAAKKKFATDVAQAVLYNLQPIGRGQLLSQKAREELNNTVTNVNPGNDLYKTLGLAANASTSSVAEAYEAKKAELAATTSPNKDALMKDVAYAHEVLADDSHKAVYDETKVEPTVFAHVLGAHTLYLYIEKMSPTTESEFEKALADASKNTLLTDLILDLRGNIGGDLAFAQTFLGLFRGPNQYAYDIFHNGAYDAQRTIGLGKVPELDRFREMSILTDNMTQSTAEIITASLKRDHRAVVVGDTTRGWGSIEQIIPMQTKLDDSETYTILLVVGLTVGDDAQQIEGRGVQPDISVKDAGWRQKLENYFYASDLIAALKKAASVPPMK